MFLLGSETVSQRVRAPRTIPRCQRVETLGWPALLRLLWGHRAAALPHLLPGQDNRAPHEEMGGADYSQCSEEAGQWWETERYSGETFDLTFC